MLRQTGDGRPRPRMESLADLIFGLSLSIGAIALIANPPANSGEINSHILAFVFSFLILITGWMIYTTQMSVLPMESRATTYLNVALLLFVALVPYLLNNVELADASLTPAASSALRDYASTLFAIDLTGVQVILALFAHVISMEEKKLVAPDVARAFRIGRNIMVICALLMLVSVAPVFWQWTLFGTPLRLYIWYLPLIFYWVGRALRPDISANDVAATARR